MAKVALLDACVLYSASLRDLLLSLAKTDMFRARWTEAINDEWVRNLKAKNPERSERIDRTRRLVNESVPDCLIFEYESLISQFAQINPKDRHVVAAAVHCRADVIVTFNLTDFPEAILHTFGISVQHPDLFVMRLLNSHSDKVCDVIKRLRTGLRAPPMCPEAYLANLEKVGLPNTVSLLRSFSTFI